MVYIRTWAEYQSAAEALYEKAPDRTRYCVKWKPSEGKLVLKITDDTTCLKYKTHSSIYLNRFEALNLSLMQKMQNVRARPPVPPPPASALASAKMEGTGAGTGGGEAQAQDSPRAGTPAPGSGGVGGSGVVQGGVVKKKKGKKKK